MAGKHILSITERAKSKMTLLLEERRRKWSGDCVLAMMWLDAKLNPGMTSRPAIGFYNDKNEVEEEISVVDGVEFVLAVSDADLLQFEGKILDFEDGCFQMKSPQTMS